jgi:hypothetical protein
MDFTEMEMRFGKPAIPVAIAPMEIGTGGMRISVTGISFGEAPKAVAVTAMGISNANGRLAPAVANLCRAKKS